MVWEENAPWLKKGTVVWVSLAGHVFQAKISPRNTIIVPSHEVARCAIHSFFVPYCNDIGVIGVDFRSDHSVPATVVVGDSFAQLAGQETLVELLRDVGGIAVKLWEEKKFTARKRLLRELQKAKDHDHMRSLFHDWIIHQLREMVTDCEGEEENEFKADSEPTKLYQPVPNPIGNFMHFSSAQYPISAGLCTWPRLERFIRRRGFLNDQ